MADLVDWYNPKYKAQFGTKAKMLKADGTAILSCEKTFAQISPSREEYPAPEKKQVVFRRYHVIGSHFRIVVTGYDDGSVEANKELY